MVSTGLKGLDIIVQDLRLGDNVVLQVDSLASYLHFVEPYIEKSLADGRNLVYIRFAQHAPLIINNNKVKTYEVDAAAGFESFSQQIHEIISKEGVGAFYLFDCLSDLLSAWATDLMIGNFFMVTCPYLFKLDTIAYFALLRDHHSFKTIARIRETTQLLLDVYHFEGQYCVHPLKVWNRHSATMFLPHLEKEGKFLPLTNSVDAAKLFSYLSLRGAETAERNLDYWDRLFLKAKELQESGSTLADKQAMVDQLNRIMVVKETRMLALIEKYFTLDDLLSIKSRMIGTGFIGGKAVGMLLARKILLSDKTFKWQDYLEPHDSFYIGSDVFYSYIVENGWWELWLEHKTEAGYFSKAIELRQKLLQGNFPSEIKEQFQQLIEYFGQSPIIIRSSSLLEDSFGNAFAGKYESVFCVNQGSPEERLRQFIDIVRQVFASTMSEDALTYRLQRGLSQQDEQMALLVQRVSGTHHRQYYFPFMAGVGLSYNTFVWHKDMDPKAGMLRLVFGLGTRAVNRVEGDYAATIALDQPLLKPFSGKEKEKRFSQHEVDVLNISENNLESISLEQMLKAEPEVKLDLIGERDSQAEEKLKQLGSFGQSWVLTFKKLLSQTEFPQIMQRLIKTLEEKYSYPVDVEFTINYSADKQLNINLVQCRPLQAKGETSQVKIPKKIAQQNLFFSSAGNFMGGSINQPIKRIIYVEPRAYTDLLFAKKFEIARIIGRLNKGLVDRDETPTLLIGPGRWGTRDASLGVPVNFAEINNISALVEIDDPKSGFMPELSFGSHFFLDLVETNIFYLALFMDDEKSFFNPAYIEKLPNILTQLIPEAADYQAVLKVYDLKGQGLKLLSDLASQRVVCLKQ